MLCGDPNLALMLLPCVSERLLLSRLLLHLGDEDGGDLLERLERLALVRLHVVRRVKGSIAVDRVAVAVWSRVASFGFIGVEC